MSLTALPDRLSDAARAFAAREHELLIGGEWPRPPTAGRSKHSTWRLTVRSPRSRGPAKPTSTEVGREIAAKARRALKRATRTVWTKL